METKPTRRSFLKISGMGIATAMTPAAFSAPMTDKPNFVIIFMNDSGFADFSPFGNPSYPATNIQLLAGSGCRFTNFHVSGQNPECTVISHLLNLNGYRTAVFDGKTPQFLQKKRISAANMSSRHTGHAVDFITRHKNIPFALCVAHHLSPARSSAGGNFRIHTGEGFYADAMAELDRTVGEIMHSLKKNGVENNTLLAFISGSGPWIPPRPRDRPPACHEPEISGSDYDNRNTCIMRFPGKIKEGTSNDRLILSDDLMPVFASYIFRGQGPRLQQLNQRSRLSADRQGTKLSLCDMQMVFHVLNS
ncbi:MAG: sulfatase-like hydrolase/transferase [Kiritimatiellia bacterium]